MKQTSGLIGNTAPLFQEKLIYIFGKRDRTDTDDAARYGWPYEANFRKNIIKLKNDFVRPKIKETDDIYNMSNCVSLILHK